MLKTKDFKIKQTPKGLYSVYRIFEERSLCLNSHYRNIEQAVAYIEWLIDYINTNYPED